MDTPPPIPSPLKSWSKKIGRVSFWLLSLFVIWLFLMMTVGPGLFEPGFILAVGWIQFLARTLPRIAWSWDLTGMGAICVGAILLLGHSFAKWITNKLASARGVDWFWPWKWTWLGICAVMIFFLVGMAAGGIAHQIGWLISSPGPWYEEKGRRGRDFMSMRQLQLGFQEVLKDEDGNIEKVRLELWKPHNDYVYQMNSWPPIKSHPPSARACRSAIPSARMRCSNRAKRWERVF